MSTVGAGYKIDTTQLHRGRSKGKVSRDDETSYVSNQLTPGWIHIFESRYPDLA
ncbi:MAG: hypothetical protein J07HX64_02046 [halophilic archaeon J07HX64]|nr:MAG: hypothetical protein J07HX64_02046 [halophilic archaeon J07HX64]